MKIIIWGYPLYTHTYSYINDGFFKAFKHIGYDVEWFSDRNYPTDYNFNDCIFLTEGFCDDHIPLNKNSIYIVHGPPNPMKYISAGVKKFIDLRYNHVWHNDHVYQYVLDKNKIEKIGKGCYFETSAHHVIKFKNTYHEYDIEDYDKFYITWATDKLPYEINLSDVNIKRNNEINFCGTLIGGGRCENMSVFKPIIDNCKKLNIPFNHNCPWKTPMSNNEMMVYIQKSILGLDLRGPEHIKNGYVPCRIMKNISYGHLGLTNSKEVYNELDGNCYYNLDSIGLFENAMIEKENKKFIKESMLYIKEHHTYINRIQSLMSIL
jgi:hypothetical protein